jgi:DNA-directed RNA polymerase specialized sigma24 family protein
MTHLAEERIRELLSKAEYAVYELRHHHRFSLRQTAHALNLSISTIRSTEERIERKLRRTT